MNGLRLLPASVAICIGMTMTGCGGGMNSPETESATSLQQRGVTYIADLDQALRWEAQTVTYRILTPDQTATDIRMAPIPCVLPQSDQVESIREGLQKWQAALGGGTRFTEVSPEKEANIDIVVQSESAFSQNTLGVTNNWVKSVGGSVLGRSVVRLDGSLAPDVFRRTALHETGHALFASGHSRNSGDVMSREFDSRNTLAELTPRDIATIRAAFEIP